VLLRRLHAALHGSAGEGECGEEQDRCDAQWGSPR
jgi:hypothetical protein